MYRFNIYAIMVILLYLPLRSQLIHPSSRHFNAAPEVQKSMTPSGQATYDITNLSSSSRVDPFAESNDFAIDDTNYIIGGGDVFFISTTNNKTIKHSVTVDKDGNLFIPDLGLVTLGKCNLLNAKEKIVSFLNSKIRDPGTIYATITHVKDVAVTVNGFTDNPGTFTFKGTFRLLDVIKSINKDRLPSPSASDLRSIKVTNNGETKEIDLLAYLYKNDKSQNPYIYPGDEIVLSPTVAKVFVGGVLKHPSPGMYPIKKNENLSNLLSYFILDSNADTNNIVVQRTAEGKTSTMTTSAEFKLYNDDVIIVPAKKNLPWVQTINVSGEVASPGSYPILNNSTTAAMIIDQAGGVTEKGNREQAVILRGSKMLPENFNKGISKLGLVRPEMSTSISMVASSADYTVISLKNREKDVFLEPGDQIVVPRLDNFVYVSGSVKKPGAYEYRSGKKINYYLKLAGGLSNKADRSNIQVAQKYGHAVQLVEPTMIERGSVILVPASQQYKFFSMVFLPLISALATTVGVGLAIYNSR